MRYACSVWQVIEGYGQTEGTAVISAQVPGDSGTGQLESLCVDSQV